MPHPIQPPSKLRHLQTLRSRTDLTPAERHELDQARIAYGPDWWLSDRQHAWQARADELAAFHSEHGRWPAETDDDPSEARLRQWLNQSRRMEKLDGPGWTPERGAYLDGVAPGWRGESREAAWKRTADDVAEFRQTNGRWPTRVATEPAERALGVWLAQNRKFEKENTHGWTTDRQAYIDTVAPGWRGEDDARWRAIADELAQYYQENGRWPRHRVGDGQERRLGHWLVSTRRQSRTGQGGWNNDRGAYLDGVAPGWRGHARDDVWHAIAAQLADFRATTGRWPRKTATDEEERLLGVWLVNVRHKHTRLSKLPEDRQQHLNALLPGWDAPRT